MHWLISFQPILPIITLTLKATTKIESEKICLLKLSANNIEQFMYRCNSVDPDQTASIGALLV